MTIRYQCQTCGSKLNIKEELAGSAGKCPKCKTEFLVPEPPVRAGESAAPHATSAATPAAKGRAQPASAPPARAKMPATSAGKPRSGDDDFDPVAFLMEDEPSPKARRRNSAPLSDDEIPAALELELSEDDEPPRRKGRSRRRVKLDSDADMAFGSASATAGAMLSQSGASAGAARDLLTRTVEESRARAARLDDEEDRGPSMVKEVARELAIKGLPALLGLLIIAYGLFRFAGAMMGGGMDLPDLARVTGTVTLDGQPLAGARVTFLPEIEQIKLSENKTIKPRSSSGITDKNGHFDLNYMEGVRGVVIGDHRVRISKRDPDGVGELVPPQFGPLSIETRRVEDGSNEILFDLTSQPAR